MRIIDLGLTNYNDAHKMQLDLVENISRGLEEDTILLTEHFPVVTFGRRANIKNLLIGEEELRSLNIEIVYTDRGGDVTYHGLGQLVAYAITNLKNEAKDIHKFLEYLEDIGINFLSKYNIFAKKVPGYRGVWVNNKKIASIGIGVKKWVTYHGIAININTDLEYFSFIRPCGIEFVQMTCIKEELGYKIDFQDAKKKIISTFKEVSALDKAKV